MTDTSTTPVPPVPTAGGDEFWIATREHRLVVPHCRRCGTWTWFPQPRCSGCLGDDLEHVTPAGPARLLSWAWHPQAHGGTGAMVVMVAFDDGFQLVSNLVDDDGAPARDASCTLDAELVVDWVPHGDGFALPVFRLAAASATDLPEGATR